MDWTRAKRCAAAALLSGAVLAGPTSGETGESAKTIRPVLEERAAARLITMRLRFERTGGAPPGACLDLGLEDLEIELRGVSRTARDGVSLEREPRPALHAVLIDTSHSMYDRLQAVRDAASEYVRQFRPELDRGMVVTFDDSVVLAQAGTENTDRLLFAIESVAPGGSTSFVDALVHALGELEGQSGRPVLVLLTDGFDTGSLHDHDDVFDRMRRLPELIVFTIGLDLPPISRSGPTAMILGRRLLQQIAHRTHGRFIQAYRGKDVQPAYLEFREMLDNEAVLGVPDPEPEAEPGKLRVRSTDPDCRVHLYRPRGNPAMEPTRGVVTAASHDLPQTVPFPPPSRHLNTFGRQMQDTLDAECIPTPGPATESDPEASWFATVGPDGIDICALDVSMPTGWLHSTFQGGRVELNQWLGLRTRHLRIDDTPPTELPAEPVELMDRLAEYALTVKDVELETDIRRRPAERHARPHVDYPQIVEGDMLLEMRNHIGETLLRSDTYRQWAIDRLRAESSREMETIVARYRKVAPNLSEDDVRAVAMASEDGSRILARAEDPSVAEIVSVLYTWHGDIAASDLFAEWEARQIDRWLDPSRGISAARDFSASWRELRRLFFAPSYVRTLGLLPPIRDRDTERIGFWRVVLPRPGFLNQRIKGYERHPEFGRLPQDLVPDEPFALRVVQRLLRDRPTLADRWRSVGNRVVSVGYELTGKHRHRNPERAFRSFRVRIEFAPDGDATEIQRFVVLGRFERGDDEVDAEPRATIVFETSTDGAPTDAVRNTRTGS